MRRVLLTALIGWAGLLPAALPLSAAPSWYKGNTHTHTSASDGDSPAETVVQWYKDHGYHFLVLSDHNKAADPDAVAAFNSPAFLVIAGEEVSDKLGKSSIHVNAFNVRSRVAPQGGKTAEEILQRDVDAVRTAGAVPCINHPNFQWGLTAEAIGRVRNARLLEVANMHPIVRNDGDATHPSVEAMWDSILTAGTRLYGVASDDTHHLKKTGPKFANPGRGWVMVRAERLEAGALFEALERGGFYASTGVTLEAAEADARQWTVRIKPAPERAYTTRFIGPEGRVLLETKENPARFEVPAGAAYVRAKVTADDGTAAWLQPVFADSKVK